MKEIKTETTGYEWISALRAGDKVVLTTKLGHKIVTVDRVTKTQVIIGGGRYRVADGREVGGSVWSTTKIEHLQRRDTK